MDNAKATFKDKVIAFATSRRAIALVVGLVSVVSVTFFGAEEQSQASLDAQTNAIMAIAGMVSTWILGDSIRKTE